MNFHGSEIACSAEYYYSASLENCLEIISLHNLPIVIALHPRSNYEKHPELFKKYKIIKGKTIDLVKTQS